MGVQGLAFWPTCYPGSTSLPPGLVSRVEVWTVWGDAFLLTLHSADVVLAFWSPATALTTISGRTSFGVQMCPCLPSWRTGLGRPHEFPCYLEEPWSRAGVSVQAGALEASQSG